MRSADGKYYKTDVAELATDQAKKKVFSLSQLNQRLRIDSC